MAIPSLTHSISPAIRPLFLQGKEVNEVHHYLFENKDKCGIQLPVVETLLDQKFKHYKKREVILISFGAVWLSIMALSVAGMVAICTLGALHKYIPARPVFLGIIGINLCSLTATSLIWRKVHNQGERLKKKIIYLSYAVEKDQSVQVFVRHRSMIENFKCQTYFRQTLERIDP